MDISDLGEDYFNYRADLLAMIGEKSGARFNMGDSVRVQVVRADLDTCRIDLTLVTSPSKVKKTKASKKRVKIVPKKK